MAIDLLGPSPVTPRGNKYVLVVMDYFTKWEEAFITGYISPYLLKPTDYSRVTTVFDSTGKLYRSITFTSPKWSAKMRNLNC